MSRQEERDMVFGLLALSIVYCLIGIGAGYMGLVGWALGVVKIELLAHSVAGVVLMLCLAPGITVWRLMRPRSRYAALVGLVLGATASLVVPAMLGAELGEVPEGTIFATLAL